MTAMATELQRQQYDASYRAVLHYSVHTGTGTGTDHSTAAEGRPSK